MNITQYFRQLVREYHRKTDAYSLTVCSGRAKNGTAVPRTSDERQRINSHERAVREACLTKAAREQNLSAKMCEQFWHDAVVEDALEDQASGEIAPSPSK